jgi:predicted RNase H-like nuclease (RuvC/YqgF family)
MIEKIKTYLKNKKKLDEENGKLKHQISLMQEHIQAQKETITKLERKLQISQEMWDLENLTKKY